MVPGWWSRVKAQSCSPGPSSVPAGPISLGQPDGPQRVHGWRIVRGRGSARRGRRTAVVQGQRRAPIRGRPLGLLPSPGPPARRSFGGGRSVGALFRFQSNKTPDARRRHVPAPSGLIVPPVTARPARLDPPMPAYLERCCMRLPEPLHCCPLQVIYLRPALVSAGNVGAGVDDEVAMVRLLPESERLVELPLSGAPVKDR